jgi:hypothetical protein
MTTSVVVRLLGAQDWMSNVNAASREAPNRTLMYANAETAGDPAVR